MNEAGWIRQTRIKQGLKGYQLAELLEVSAARVSVIEKDEMRGAVTLKMMEKVARALGCRFDYQLVPEKANKNTVDKSSEHTNTKPRYRVVGNELINGSERRPHR